VIISRPTRYDTFDPEGWWRSRSDAKEVLAEYEKLVNHWVQSAVSNLTGWLWGRDRSAAEAQPPPDLPALHEVGRRTGARQPLRARGG